MSFRKQLRYLFATYSNCPDISIDDFCAELLQIIPPLQYDGFRLAKELHAQGTPHFHLALAFSKRIDITNPRRFDILGQHPKLEQCRSYGASVSYCAQPNKPGYIASIDYPSEETVDTIVAASNSSSQTGAVEAATNIESYPGWLDYCIEQHIGFGFAKEIWNISHKDRGTTLEEGYEEKGQILSRQLEALRFDPERKSWAIWGNSTGVGKSTWVRINAPKPALVLSHIDRLKYFDPDYHVSIIFEEMSFTHLPITAQIKLVDEHQAMDHHIRYGVVTIPAAIHKFFTSNAPTFDFNDIAINRRIVSVDTSPPIEYGNRRADRIG